MDLAAFENRAEEFEETVTREDYLSGAGLKDTLEIAAIYDRYADLFTRDTVDSLLKNRLSAAGLQLANFATLNYLENTVKELSEESTNQALKMTVRWDGQEIPYRSAPVVLANEPDAGRRHELQRLIMDKTNLLNPILSDRMQRLHQGVIALGFPSYTVMCDDLRQLQLGTLTNWMQTLLDRTAASYAERLDGYLHSLGLTRADAYNSDLSYLFRAPIYDHLFPKESLVPALRTTLAGLGLDLDAQKNLELDLAPRPLKSPRAFCAPIRVPDEIKLVISPRGGQDDYRAILHEAGHAEHGVFTAADVAFAFKRLGDNSVTEGYAFLFDNLVQNRAWLTEVLELADGSEYLSLAIFYKTYMLRRYATKLIYEQELHAGQPNMEQRYVRLFEENLLVKHWPQNYLSDVDDFYYSAQYIRAWIFEVQLRRFFEKSWGVDWFRNPEAGSFLVGFYRRGQKNNADELAQELGYAGLDPDPLIAELGG